MMSYIDESLDGRASIYDSNREGNRVLVALDVKNLVCGQSQVYSNTAIDYRKLLEDILDGRRCVLAVAVDGVFYDERGRDVSRIFHDELKRSGFTVDLVEATNGHGKQEGVDIELSLVAFGLADKCDVVELITGDGDYTVLIKWLHSKGVRVNVTSLRRNLSDRLGCSADGVEIADRMPLVRMRSRDAEAE